MKVYTLSLTMALLISASLLAQPVKTGSAATAKPKKPVLKTLKDSASYALGFNIGQNLAQRYTDMDMDMMILALKEAYASKPCAIDAATGPMIVNNYIMDVTRQKAEANKVTGKKFLEANAKKPGIKTTPSGLQYEVIKQGSGEIPTSNDVVKVHYSGKLINGKEFDNSMNRGGPAEFGVGGVIAGWTEALQMMATGSKYKLYIPAHLAYGDSQMGTEIPPGSVLIFDIELLEVKKSDPPKTAEPIKENGQ